MLPQVLADLEAAKEDIELYDEAIEEMAGEVELVRRASVQMLAVPELGGQFGSEEVSYEVAESARAHSH